MAGGAGERIFVYGTLRRGGSRDARVHYPGAEFVGPARVRGALHDLGEYPGLRLDAAAGWVRGELFDVTPQALAGLDEWEGFDPERPDAGEYRRVRGKVERGSGDEESCWVYEIRAERAATASIIASGDWLARERES